MNEINTILLIVDIQEKLIKGIPNKSEITNNVSKLIKASKVLGVEIIYSEQNPNKLGSTIKELQDEEQNNTYSKMGFSCCSCRELMIQIENSKKKIIVIVGIETHICIQQTCLDLISKGFEVYLILDGINSRKAIDHETAIKRIESKGAVVTTTEAVIFEWCRTADRKEFKSISSVIKESAI